MKKLFFTVFVLLFSFLGEVEAQTHKFYSTSFAFMQKYSSGYWSDWSDWESSRCLITISLDRGVINIYSDEMQEFDIIESDDDWRRDNRGGEQFELLCVDRDGLRCGMRLRVYSEGDLQLYVDYNDLIYVYNLQQRN